MLSTEKKTAALRAGIFEGLDDQTLEAMAGRMGQRELADGEILFMRGEPGDEIFVIIEGSIEIFIEQQVIAVLGAGEIFGEMAVLGGGVRTAGGRAKGNTTLLFLKEKAIKLLIQQDPDLAFTIFHVLIQRLEDANRLGLFLSAPKKTYGWVEIVEGELAGRQYPIHHKQATLGQSRHSVSADALRIALPSTDDELTEHHALVTIDADTTFIEPQDGDVYVNDELIDTSFSLAPEDRVRMGGLTMQFSVAAQLC